MGTVEHPNCTKCGEAIRGDIYHIGGGNFHIWCAPKVEFPVGCICPPGANLQCERFDCPRKREIEQMSRTYSLTKDVNDAPHVTLQPCPFCHNAEPNMKSLGDSWYVECGRCTAQMHAVTDRDQAAENWNDRTPPHPQQRGKHEATHE